MPLLLTSSILLYIGPGMSGGVLTAIIGILASFVFSMIAILWYPLKKLFHFIRAKFDRQ
jgi:hypothetical protein